MFSLKKMYQSEISRFYPFSNKWVVFFLLLPIVSLSVYFLFCEHPSTKDFLLNFGTEMIGVFVSVMIIGWLINKKEYRMWNEVDSAIIRKYISFYSKTITTFLYLFQMYSDIFSIKKKFPSKKERINQELTFLSGELSNKLTHKIKSFDKDKFNMFKEFITKTEENLDNLYIYPNRLSNEQVIFLSNAGEILDELQRLMHLFYMSDYKTFQGVLEIDPDFIKSVSNLLEKLIHTIVAMRKNISID